MNLKERFAALKKPVEPPPTPPTHKPAQKQTQSHKFAHSRNEAERGVLGSILAASMSPDQSAAKKLMARAESAISSEHFQAAAHKHIWESLQALYSANEPLDFIAVTTELEAANLLDSVGGAAYVTDLATFIPTSQNLDYFIAALKEQFQIRAIQRIASELLEKSKLPKSDPSELLHHAKANFDRLSLISSNSLDSGVEVSPLSQLIDFNPKNDQDSVLGFRWLCKGGSCLWVGQSGIGKSSLAMQAGMLWAQARPFFGVRPTHGKPLRSLYIQAENDPGDMAEMMQGVLKGFPLPKGQSLQDFAHEMQDRLIFVRDTVHTSADFARNAARLIEKYKPDLVWVDPLLSYAGDDLSSQKVASHFLRNLLNPIAFTHGIVWMLLHHTGKPSSDPKSQSHWGDSDASYAAFGSSELVNWARAVNVLQAVKDSDGQFSLRFAKRGKRAGLTTLNPDPNDLTPPQFTETVFLKHADEGIFWEQVATPEPSQQARAEKGKFDEKFTTSDFLDLLHKHNNGKTPSEFKRLATEQLLCSESTFKRAWRDLKSSPYLEEKNGRYYLSPIYSPPSK